jgi:hypothetical protein
LVADWTLSDWLILVVDVLAIVVVATFLKRKIQHKLREVEARQAHERLMRKNPSASNTKEAPPK